MTPFEYLKKKRKVRQTALLTRRPPYVVDAAKIMEEIHTEKQNTKEYETVKGKQVILQTEDELFIRVKAFELLAEKERSGCRN